MPGKHRISGDQAMLFIGSIRKRLSIIALDGDEYADALEASAALGVLGGGIYDAMLAHCAIKARKRSIRGTGASMRNADRRSHGVCGRCKGFIEQARANIREAIRTLPRRPRRQLTAWTRASVSSFGKR